MPDTLLGLPSATTGSDGLIYIDGGTAHMLVYDPRTDTWTSLGVTLNARQALAATTGPDGHVCAVGGVGYGNGKLLEVIR